MVPSPTRELHLSGAHCALTIRQFPGRVIILRVSGTDIGELESRAAHVLTGCLIDNQPIHLFIDARDVSGPSIAVSGEWAAWLRAQQASLRNVSMLAGPRYVRVTAGFMRRFAGLRGVIRIYTEPAEFDAAVADSLNVEFWP